MDASPATWAASLVFGRWNPCFQRARLAARQIAVVDALVGSRRALETCGSPLGRGFGQALLVVTNLTLGSLLRLRGVLHVPPRLMMSKTTNDGIN